MISGDGRSKLFIDRLLALDRPGAKKILDQARGKDAPLRLVENLIVPALEEIGRAWDQGDVALAQVYMSSKICEELVDQFLPMSSSERIKHAKMGIALLDDYHALGKMIIYATLRASGYELHDYGRVTAAELVRRVCDDGVRILLISTLMFRSALQVKEVKTLLTTAGSPARIIVGGAPFRFDPELWKEMGADYMGTNAAEAVRAVSRCMEEWQ